MEHDNDTGNEETEMEIKYNPQNKQRKFEVWSNEKKIKTFQYENEAERYVYIQTLKNPLTVDLQ